MQNSLCTFSVPSREGLPSNRSRTRFGVSRTSVRNMNVWSGCMGGEMRQVATFERMWRSLNIIVRPHSTIMTTSVSAGIIEYYRIIVRPHSTIMTTSVSAGIIEYYHIIVRPHSTIMTTSVSAGIIEYYHIIVRPHSTIMTTSVSAGIIEYYRIIVRPHSTIMTTGVSAGIRGAAVLNQTLSFSLHGLRRPLSLYSRRINIRLNQKSESKHFSERNAYSGKIPLL